MFSAVPLTKSKLAGILPAAGPTRRISRFTTLGVNAVCSFPAIDAPCDCHVSEILRADREFLARFVDKLTNICSAYTINYSCFGRVKSFNSTCAKMRRRGFGYDDILDLIGIRIVVQDVEQCYKLLSRIRALYPRRTHSIRDYVAYPKLNGYQSLHISVRSYEQRRLEVQIRTRAMNEDSERGPSAHTVYKVNCDLSVPLLEQ